MATFIPFLYVLFGTFCPFSAVLSDSDIDKYIAKLRNTRLSMDNQIIYVFGVNVVYV